MDVYLYLSSIYLFDIYIKEHKCFRKNLEVYFLFSFLFFHKDLYQMGWWCLEAHIPGLQIVASRVHEITWWVQLFRICSFKTSHNWVSADYLRFFPITLSALWICWVFFGGVGWQCFLFPALYFTALLLFFVLQNTDKVGKPSHFFLLRVIIHTCLWKHYRFYFSQILFIYLVSTA